MPFLCSSETDPYQWYTHIYIYIYHWVVSWAPAAAISYLVLFVLESIPGQFGAIYDIEFRVQVWRKLHGTQARTTQICQRISSVSGCWNQSSCQVLHCPSKKWASLQRWMVSGVVLVREPRFGVITVTSVRPHVPQCEFREGRSRLSTMKIVR